ncbi:hypothetical protein PAXRUDRAFT_148736, partial [Paxillus rubicundulus Ve08.2h10]
LELYHNCGFDVDVSQFVTMPQQLTRLQCFYPPGHPHLLKTPVTSPGKHVCIRSVIVHMEGEQCVVVFKDIALGPSNSVANGPTPDTASHLTSKAFDWGGRNNGKRQHENDSDDENKKASTSSAHSAD